MNDPAKITKLKIPKDTRVICISDIHGNLDLFTRLLEKVEFSCDDLLLLLGDFYTKGPQSHETLKCVIELCKKHNVHPIRGNSDWITDEIDESEKDWIESLPHIIETDDYIFVHGGLTSSDLNKQEARACMKNDAFMEKGLSFEKYIITGHWPTVNYCHQIPCHNPIINEEKRIIAIDGGTIKKAGQLNAFMIHNGAFAFDCVDALPVYCAEKNQPESGGTLNITWKDRFIELVEKDDEFGLYRHIETGKELSIPNESTWIDENGNLCSADLATDYYLPVNAGDVISVEKRFSDRLFAKKDGVMGWVGL